MKSRAPSRARDAALPATGWASRGQQTSPNPTKCSKGPAFRAQTALQSDTCFVVLEVSDARKGGGACARAAAPWPRPTGAGKVEVMDAFHTG